HYILFLGPRRVWNSSMDKRSSIACFMVMLVLLGSSMTAENCEIKRDKMTLCIKSECLYHCQHRWYYKITQYWCDGVVFGFCNCKICIVA
uniref:Knottin scorpion toxin-like domain-containing protein n=1 Tax=Aegilops tauschii subsp. strangulata TaxID=200361 RepID=A0A453MNQ4_AEGTS